MIIAIVVSIFPAQGASAQEEQSSNSLLISNYEHEQDQYTEISHADLPTSIQEATDADFRHLHVHKAYISKNNTYKMVLRNELHNTQVVFASANGEWIDLKMDDSRI